jgi:hypothetical protein
MPQFCQFGEQVFVFGVVFIGPQVFKTKAVNDSDELGYCLLVTAGQWSMCWILCLYESVTPNACSWRSLIKTVSVQLNTRPQYVGNGEAGGGGAAVAWRPQPAPFRRAGALMKAKIS